MLSIYEKKLMYQHLSLEIKESLDHKTTLVFQSDQIESTYNDLKSKDVNLLNQPHDVPGWGDRCFHLLDPEGNLIEINQILNPDKWDDDLKEHKDAKNIINNYNKKDE